ncbi:MAG: CDP-diacylglycerol--glycerol-3-phosphate 3-phosphatidyltransferase [Rickettsiales bacterium]|jgi:CDP-diacylglycerol--glycerol-3-phosphate 3-phosphatidyltransferase|nr:CDP-diacylglycerol--glycerol-3-phosphate 3-phosphatidyltransferase [Rickettsiales bacterium]
MKKLVNGLSIFRIIAAFALLPMMFLQLWGMALILFVLAAASDYADGYLARRFKATSKLGGVLDHTGDKFLVAISLLIAMLAVQTPLVISLVAIMICRDLFVSGLREFMGSQKMELPVDKTGKLKTVAQLVALMIFFLFFYIYMNDMMIDAQETVLDSAIAMLGVSAALSVWSAAGYTIKAIRKMK